MRRLFTFILLTTLCSVFINAQEWNISNAEFNELGTLSETTVVNGLTIWAHSEKTVTIDANNKSLDGMEFTHRLKLGGAGDFDENGQPLGRVLSFDVSGDAKITVMGMSSSSGEDRELNLAIGHKDSIFATFPALGPEISKGEYNYSGGPATIYLYSPGSGVNVYYLKAEPEQTTRDWNISSEDFNALGTVNETTTVNGLTIWAHSEKTVTIDANNKSLDGMEFTHRLKLGGAGDFDENGQPLGRVLSFNVSGDAKITVMGMSSSSGEDRELNLAIGHKDSIFATFPALGPEISKGEYNYSGGPATIYLYSSSSGVNVYYLKVEEAIEETTGSDWNISAEDFNTLGTLTEKTVVNGLTIWAHSEKTVTIDANNKSLDGMEFTHRLKLGGVGDFDENGLPLGRVVSFEVEGNTEITVMGMSSSSGEDRELQLAVDHKDSIFATFPALGPEISKGVYSYTGGAGTIFLYSSSSGVNIYYLKAEPLTTFASPEIQKKQVVRVYPNPATDRVFVKVNEPTQVAIYNLAGSMVKSRMIESQKDFINISDLQPGMYLIKSQFTNDFTQKLIVK